MDTDSKTVTVDTKDTKDAKDAKDTKELAEQAKEPARPAAETKVDLATLQEDARDSY